MGAKVLKIDAGIIAVLADCHIHPGGGPEFPPHVLAALADAHLIVVLGDMGEAAGLDQLEAITTVVGVHGEDDADDPRTDAQALVIENGRFRFGCVFDATAAGLAVASDPFAAAADFAATAERLFRGRVDLVLHAGTHRSSSDAVGGVRLLNPGSAILPAERAAPTFGRIEITAGGFDPQIVFLG